MNNSDAETAVKALVEMSENKGLHADLRIRAASSLLSYDSQEKERQLRRDELHGGN